MSNNTGVPQVKMQIPLQSLHKTSCVCGGKRFVEVFSLRVANRFQSPSGQAMIIKTPTGFLCSDCGLMNNFDKETRTSMEMFSTLKGDQNDAMDEEEGGE